MIAVVEAGDAADNPRIGMGTTQSDKSRFILSPSILVISNSMRLLFLSPYSVNNNGLPSVSFINFSPITMRSTLSNRSIFTVIV